MRVNLKGRRVSIIGAGRSGVAAALKIKLLGGIPFLSDAADLNELDTPENIINKFEYETGGHTKRILQADLIILSPGVPPNISILQKAKQNGIPIWSEIELGYRLIDRDYTTIIAVTGSNGKSTTVSLIYHILNQAGEKVLLAGNIGQPLTAFPIEDNIFKFIVLEVSSFQLETIYEFRPHISIILNITPDHLNRYKYFSAYVYAKSRILMNQCNEDLSILNYDDPECRTLGRRISIQKEFYSVKSEVNPYIYVYGRELHLNFPHQPLYKLPLETIPLRGMHNIGNLAATALACQSCGITVDNIVSGMLSFKPLEHRLEPVANINNVTFINDSKATNSNAVLVAIQSFDAPLHLIMGGSDKNEDFHFLIPYFAENVKSLTVYGETTTILYETFSKYIPTYTVRDLSEAVERAFSHAKQGEYVLFSPGCASYDMFKNFEERGKAFKQIVNRLSQHYGNTK
jgi:UDP-N-acetylmuramoylalanine--D-glutamate ligase